MPDRPTTATMPGDAFERRKQVRLMLAATRGFCAGVRRAIAAVEDALATFAPPVYVRRAIVHNMAVVRELESKGAVFIEELEEVPDGAVVILSAHGVPLSVKSEAERRGLRYFDAVCPLVAKVHREVVKHHRDGRPIVLIGHEGHPEIAGTLGQIPAGAAKVISSACDVASLPFADHTEVAFVTQTTYSVDEASMIVEALEARFPRALAPASSDICYATTNRQSAVKAMAPHVDAIIVAGERFSSNACRLVEVARAHGCPSVQLVADPSQLDPSTLESCGTIGLTAAASTPESTVSLIIERLGEFFALNVEEFGEQLDTASFKPLKIERYAPVM